MQDQTKPRAPKSTAPKSTAKMVHPHNAFRHPAQVVADTELSKDEKRRALESLEQDAKQLATATDEGMEGGESANLRDVLLAKKALDLPASEHAFAIVLQTFESKLAKAQGTGVHAVIANAIDAIISARAAIERLERVPAVPPGAPEPGSEQELEEELEKEKLDP
jgi:hypothetical protein